jgi:hypothetical protein
MVPRGAHYAGSCADVLAAVKGVPVLAIPGNHDHWNNAAIVEGALKDRGIQVLRNRSIPLERGRSRIWIAGADDALVEAADLGKTLHDAASSETTLSLAHEPDFADYAARFPIDLQLSGHSHGGQVRVPGIWRVDTASSGKKISHRFEPGGIFAGLYQSRSGCDQPAGALLLSTRGYVRHLASGPASLTLLSSSLYTQIYSQCRSTRPKMEQSGRLSLKGKCEPH